jgi:basic membrane protein A
MILDGTFVPFSYYGNMMEGYIDIAPLSPLVPADVAAVVNEVRSRMIAGQFAPFSGEIFYADGRQLSAEGQTLTRAEIWSINDVIRGVNAQ